MTNIGATVLLRNNGDGRSFTDMAGPAGVEVSKIGTEDRVTWGSVFFDYDNDGFEDIYMVSGYLRLPGVDDVPSYLAGAAQRPAAKQGRRHVQQPVGRERRGRPPAWAGAWATWTSRTTGASTCSSATWAARRPSTGTGVEYGNNWLVVKTVGKTSNRDGIGARITVKVGGVSQVREVASGRSFMGHPMIAPHFGLGGADMVDEIVVRWPSGAVQTVSSVEPNRRITITEPN